jgi:hypothetical protein
MDRAIFWATLHLVTLLTVPGADVLILKIFLPKVSENCDH